MSDASVTAFGTTRHGGHGSGAYATLNCTPYTGDDPEVVQANQELVHQELCIPTDRLTLPILLQGLSSLLLHHLLLFLLNILFILHQGIEYLLGIFF